jgi:hypothetical protein
MTSPSVPVVPLAARTPEEVSSADLLSEKRIRDQLERILGSPVFRNSKRYAAVLRYIVEQTLARNGRCLKERTIGVDVFGREPDYDTSSDHVVRSAMAEVRKRLAQYYQENGSRNEVYVELSPGSYVPQFRAVPDPVRLDTTADALDEISRADSESRSFRLRWTVVAAAVLFVLSAAFLLRARRIANDPVANFWGPVLASPNPILLCAGNLEGGRVPGSGESPVDLRPLSMGDFHRLPSQTIHVSDAIALAKIASFFQARDKAWKIAAQTDTTFADLTSGPAILIGLMNNDWTARLVKDARFRPERTAPRTVVIRDSRNPSKQDWSMDYSTPLLNINKDYALVLRALDPNTDQTVVAAAGISVFGTLAAAEFLTDARELSKLDTAAPGWRKKNLEVVLSTEVVRAKSGRPRILATHTW